VAMQFNYFTDEGAVKYDEATGKFSVDEAKIREAVLKLTTELLTIEAEGSYDKAAAILDKFAVIRPPMKSAFDKLKTVPVDIEPIFPLAK
jgi:phage baseplate assembly protein gpV